MIRITGSSFLWVGAIGLISFSVFLSGGGINTIKSLCVVAGLPMMFIYAILVRQLLGDLGIMAPSKSSQAPAALVSRPCQG